MSDTIVQSSVSVRNKELALRTRTAISRVSRLSAPYDRSFSFVGDLVADLSYTEVSKMLGIEGAYLRYLGVIRVCAGVRGYSYASELRFMTGCKDHSARLALEVLNKHKMIVSLPTKQPLAGGRVLVTGYVPTAYGLEVMDMIADMWKRLVKDINRGILPIDRKKA